MKMQRIISASLAPNLRIDDFWLALRLIFKPWAWQKGKGINLLNAWFQDKFPNYFSYAYNSGRSAEYEILRAFGIGKGDEVIVQSFTCVAVPNSVLWTQAKPIYVDIDESLNATPEAIHEKITSKTKAIIVQHTFGNPSNIKQIIEMAHKKNILVIEDCAHSLGVKLGQQMLGSFGDAAFFSFGRDKVVSSVFGGVGIINSTHKKAISAMSLQYENQKSSRNEWVFQQLLHPIAFAVILPLYNLYLGKILLVLLQKLHLLSFPVYPEEKQGVKPKDFPALLPNSLALLAINQLNKLPNFIKTRKHAQNRYWKELQNLPEIILPEKNDDAVYLRFPILLKFPNELRKFAKSQGVLLGNWYANPVDPSGVNLKAIEYVKNSALVAEKMVETVINLPTLINDLEVSRVIKVIQSFCRKQNP